MKKIVLGTALLAIAAPVSAKQLWNDNSFSVLKGSNYEVPYSDEDDERTVFTFEHVSGQSWGDVFLFVDRLESSDNNNETYAEFSPRLSLGKISGKSMKFGIVQDVLITTTAEYLASPKSFGTPDQTHYLVGPAIDLALPGFAYFQLNVYHRDNDGDADSNWQMTPVWGVPFKISSLSFLYDGFIDWRSAVSDEGKPTETNFTSQLKMDVGALWSMEKTLYAGVEYVYWKNKYGLKDKPFETDEKNLNLLVKLHF